MKLRESICDFGAQMTDQRYSMHYGRTGIGNTAPCASTSPAAIDAGIVRKHATSTVGRKECAPATAPQPFAAVGLSAPAVLILRGVVLIPIFIIAGTLSLHPCRCRWIENHWNPRLFAFSKPQQCQCLLRYRSLCSHLRHQRSRRQKDALLSCK